MALAAQIQNLPPQPTPPVPVQVQGKPKRRRTGGGDFPESNLYDPVADDYNHPYYDGETLVGADMIDSQRGVGSGQPKISVSISPLSVEVDIFDIVTGVDDDDGDGK
jgi:hypothetical protein